MILLTALTAAVFGLLVGSFLNVCIYRLPLGESVVMPRSRCRLCGVVLGPASLVPVLSWLIQRGKCRSCHAPVSPRYAFVEILTAAIFWFVYVRWMAHGDVANAAAFLYFFCVLIVITFIDIDHMLIFDVVTYPGMAVGLALAAWGHAPLRGDAAAARLIDSLIGLALGAGILWVIQFLGSLWYRTEAMGLGDVKLAALTGAFLGARYEIAALLFAIAIGGALAVVMIVAGKRGRKDYVPFGPALAAGAALAPFFGDRILALYGF